MQPAALLPLFVLGAYPFAVFGHSNLRLRLGWVEPLFVTPRIHRRHHVPETTDRNFGTIFTFWDRLAGSLVVRDTSIDEPLGVPGEVATYPQAFHHALLEPIRQLRRLPQGRSRRQGPERARRGA